MLRSFFGRFYVVQLAANGLFTLAVFLDTRDKRFGIALVGWSFEFDYGPAYAGNNF